MAKNNSKWSNKEKELAINLHKELSLDERNWHKYKSDNERRAAELLSGALVQLIIGENYSEVEALTKQSILWIKGSVKDPGCNKSFKANA